MRIRSIKPEFWRSEDVTSLAIEDRLLFIALWSYVDDNGVGLDKLAAVAADLFAADLELDAPETFARVSRGLQNLSDRGRIVRYEASGKALLYVVNWEKHQKIDKPNKERYPRPDQGFPGASLNPREGVARVSRLEQGNRGTEEEGTGEQISPSAADGAGGEFSEDVLRLCGLLADLVRANGHKVGVVGKQWWLACDRLLRLDGYTPEQVEVIARWSTSDEFWSANIRSMPTLREKFSTLRARRNQDLGSRKQSPSERALATIALGAEQKAVGQ